MDNEEAKTDDGRMMRIAKDKWECKYWRPALTADIVIFGYGVSENDQKEGKDIKRLSVLLIKRGCYPFEGQWALPGGFMQQEDHSIKVTAIRELEEETKLNMKSKVDFLEEFGVFSDEGRDPRDRVVTVAFMAMVRTGDFEVKGGSDAREARWFTVEEVQEQIKENKAKIAKEGMTESHDKRGWLAFDHDRIFETALNKLKRDLYLRPIGLNLLDEEFTIPQLYNLYFSILHPDKIEASNEEKDKLIDRPNFIKRMSEFDFLEKAKKRNEAEEEAHKQRKKVVAHRRPTWYSFNKERYKELMEGDVAKNGIQLIFNSRKNKKKDES